MLTLNCSAILFDLDGVLVDSTGSVDRQWRAWAREHGIDEQKVIDVAHGVRTIEVIRRVAPHIDAETEVLRLEQREAESAEDLNIEYRVKTRAVAVKQVGNLWVQLTANKWTLTYVDPH